MIAFYGKAEIKRFYLERIRFHRLMGSIVQDPYHWNGRTGAAACCLSEETLDPMYTLQREWDVPVAVFCVMDKIHRGLPAEAAQAWPEQFTEAVAVGADLTPVVHQFSLWLLTECNGGGGLKALADERRRRWIEPVEALLKRSVAGDNPPEAEWMAVVRLRPPAPPRQLSGAEDEEDDDYENEQDSWDPILGVTGCSCAHTPNPLGMNGMVNGAVRAFVAAGVDSSDACIAMRDKFHELITEADGAFSTDSDSL